MARQRSPAKPLAKKLDGDFRRNFLDRFLNFLAGLGQPIGVDIDSNAAPRTGHVLVRLEPPDCLSEIVSAFRTLKPDLIGLNASHREMPLVQS